MFRIDTSLLNFTKVFLIGISLCFYSCGSSYKATYYPTDTIYGNQQHAQKEYIHLNENRDAKVALSSVSQQPSYFEQKLQQYSQADASLQSGVVFEESHLQNSEVNHNEVSDWSSSDMGNSQNTVIVMSTHPFWNWGWSSMWGWNDPFIQRRFWNNQRFWGWNLGWNSFWGYPNAFYGWNSWGVNRFQRGFYGVPVRNARMVSRLQRQRIVGNRAARVTRGVSRVPSVGSSRSFRNARTTSNRGYSQGSSQRTSRNGTYRSTSSQRKSSSVSSSRSRSHRTFRRR